MHEFRSLSLSLCLSVCVFLSLSVSVCLSVSLSVSLSKGESNRQLIIFYIVEPSLIIRGNTREKQLNALCNLQIFGKYVIGQYVIRY